MSTSTESETTFWDDVYRACQTAPDEIPSESRGIAMGDFEVSTNLIWSLGDRNESLPFALAAYCHFMNLCPKWQRRNSKTSQDILQTSFIDLFVVVRRHVAPLCSYQLSRLADIGNSAVQSAIDQGCISCMVEPHIESREEGAIETIRLVSPSFRGLEFARQLDLAIRANDASQIEVILETKRESLSPLQAGIWEILGNGDNYSGEELADALQRRGFSTATAKSVSEAIRGTKKMRSMIIRGYSVLHTNAGYRVAP